MANILLFIPTFFRWFGMFRSFIGFVRPMWPHLSRFFTAVAYNEPLDLVLL